MSHVNVAMRVRPTAENTGDYITLVPPGTMVINKPGSGDMYQFGYTFAAQDVTNEHVYEQVGKPVVDSVLEGYNGTVLAYGQTGSGAPVHKPASLHASDHSTGLIAAGSPRAWCSMARTPASCH